MGLTIKQRLEKYSAPEPNTGCWLWMGPLRKIKGYGAISVGGKTRVSHRVSWEIYKGPIPNGLLVLHKCDVRSCINPDHLFLGTNKDNMADMVKKGRLGKRLGGRGGINAKLAKSDIPVIRKLISDGLVHRVIAERFGVCRTTIGAINQGINWKHL